MSQHIYSTSLNGRSVKVLMGFDRSLQGYFLEVYPEDTADSTTGDEQAEDDDGYIYSNLADIALLPFAGLPPTLDHFLKKLNAMGLSVPQAMIDGVRSDGINNVGNRTVTYGPD